MKEYITFHQVTLDKDNIGIKKLFALNTNAQIGAQQAISPFLRNPKNSNQIEIPEHINIIEHEYNKFSNTNDAFDIIKNYIYSEFKIDEDDIDKAEVKTKDLYFNIFDDEQDEKPKFRGVLHATTTAVKPLYYVALRKNLEYEYDRELYKKW